MSPVWALLLAATGGPSGSEEPRIRVAERSPVAIVVHSPTGESGQVGFSDVIRAIDERVKRYTDLEPQTVDSALFSGCEGRLSCLVRVTRRDYQRERLRLGDGRYAPYSKHRMRLREEGIVVPGYMLIVTHVAVQGRPDRVVAHFFNTDLALQVYHEAPRRPGWADAVEDQVLEQAVLAEMRQPELLPSGVDAFAESLFTEHLRPVLAARGHWLPFGTVEVRDAPAGGSVEVDGRTVGVTREGSTRLEEVPPGAHQVRIRHPDYQDLEASVVVETGRTALVQGKMKIDRSRSSAGPQVVFWSGAALAAAGLGVLVYAVASDSGARTVCVGDGADFCTEGTRFQAGSIRGSDPGVLDPGPGGGVLLAPLGYSMLGSGLIMSVGSKTFEKKSEFPWWSVGIGLAAGAAAYGISAAVDGG